MGFLAIVFPDPFRGKVSKTDGRWTAQPRNFYYLNWKPRGRVSDPCFISTDVRAGGKQPSGNKIAAGMHGTLSIGNVNRWGTKVL